MKTRNRKKGSVMMFIGFLLLAAALFLTAYNIYDAKRAEDAADAVISELRPQIEENADTLPGQEDTISAEAFLNPDREMPAIEINDYRYVGILEIPALGLSLPIMEEWDYSRLKISPCVYEGSVYQDNMIIAGHNYAKHFSPIKNLPVGTTILFTDVENHVFEYQIGWIDVLAGDAVEEMSSGDWDLTLFTCTYGGNARYAVRCIRK